MNTDPRVDAYVAKAASFAQPILKEVRARVRKACPDAEETIKWNVPFYVLGGKLLASMAAFKQHTKIGVWADMRPTFYDVTSVAELPSAKEFAQSLNAAASLGAAPKSVSTSKKPTAEKPAAQKSTTKKASKKSAPAAKPKKSAAKQAAPAAEAKKAASGKPRVRASKA
jgi:hypothetical protein